MCVIFLHYISDEIKTTRDQVTTQSNIPVSNFVLLNSVIFNSHTYLFIHFSGSNSPGLVPTQALN